MKFCTSDVDDTKSRDGLLSEQQSSCHIICLIARLTLWHLSLQLDVISKISSKFKKFLVPVHITRALKNTSTTVTRSILRDKELLGAVHIAFMTNIAFNIS